MVQWAWIGGDKETDSEKAAGYVLKVIVIVEWVHFPTTPGTGFVEIPNKSQISG